MTKKQEQILREKINNAAKKGDSTISASAWWHMRHKPYQGGKRNEKTDDTKEGHEPGHGHAGPEMS